MKIQKWSFLENIKRDQQDLRWRQWKEVLIYFSTNHILFEFDQTIVVSRLIEGEYFRINQMLSSDYETKVTINKKEFLDCIERATILIRENDKNRWS